MARASSWTRVTPARRTRSSMPDHGRPSSILAAVLLPDAAHRCQPEPHGRAGIAAVPSAVPSAVTALGGADLLPSP